MSPIYVDFLALALTTALFGYYFVTFIGRLRNRPEHILQGLNRLARGRWARWVLEDTGRVIAAVQTLRNGIMAGTFFASVAMLLILGALNLIGREPLAAAWHPLMAIGSHGNAVQTVKSLLLVADFALAFFTFALSVRLLVHAGYYVLPAPGEPEASARRLAFLIDRSALYYTYGMRAYWMAVPLVFWLFNPLLMAAAAAVVVPLLFRLDRTGRELSPGIASPN